MDRHRIIGQHSDDPLVRRNGERRFVMDDLHFADARDWHHVLLSEHQPHRWQKTDGGPSGWNDVAAYKVEAEWLETIPVAAFRIVDRDNREPEPLPTEGGRC